MSYATSRTSPALALASIATRVRRYLKQKRSMGYEMATQSILLMQFARYAARHRLTGPLKSCDLIAWATEDSSHSRRYRANRLTVVRGFARHCAAEDGRSEIPPVHLLPAGLQRRQPHLFAPQQIADLLGAASHLSPIYPHRPIVYRTLLGLLACTGMRVSEALAMTLNDVDLDQGVVVVRHTKFGKSRLVPLHPTAQGALRGYLRQRDPKRRACGSEPLLVGAGGTALPYTTVLHTFRLLIRRLGLQNNGTLASIRMHDLRHSFACERLLEWYREGVDVDQAIASLSTYLGHAKVTDTYWYLTGTGELLSTVAERFEQFASADQIQGRRA